MKQVNLRQDWSGYSRGYNELTISVPDDATDEEVLKIAENQEFMAEQETVRDDRSYEEWEIL